MGELKQDKSDTYREREAYLRWQCSF